MPVDLVIVLKWVKSVYWMPALYTSISLRKWSFLVSKRDFDIHKNLVTLNPPVEEN